MNSSWQINRVGLIDFWYYDEEEFYFLDGRMLLRGSNGSGKSVTMQSFIPLLLDGNMRPERLDPFGSRARKMENYLLEEGDEREERTGYLYMEFKRMESDTYLTVGIGIRCRKNKKLDSWYFCITDGRRVGKDIFLYKDVQHKVAYTRQELKNRIGEGGKLMETQGEYAQCINRLLFGFDTMEEYKEMLELLIQLRTPKLSKDFKPTVIHDILSSSLQTLSEEDLRPMSEAIENMDSLKTNMDALADSIKAAKQIERVYDQYNQSVLLNKALLFTNEKERYQDGLKKEKQLSDRVRECEEELEKELESYQGLVREEAALLEERKRLDESDATKIKEEEVALKREQEEQKSSLERKGRQYEEKRQKQQETQLKIKKQSEENEGNWQKIEGCLEEMEEELEGIPFDEFSFMKRELLEGQTGEYAFRSHGTLLQEYTRKVEAGKEALAEEIQARKQYDLYLKEMDRHRSRRDVAQRELLLQENLLQEIKGELSEQVCHWEKENQELKPEPKVQQEVLRFIEQYQMGMDYSEIQEKIRAAFHEREDALREAISVKQREKKEICDQRAELEEELNQWEAKKDPEPEQPQEVRENRKLLKEKGIPYYRFYKMVDFEDSLDKQTSARLEEAFLRMGILDALIVPAEYRVQIRALDPGNCDTYIFSDIPHVKQNLMQALSVYNGDNDILLYQEISNVLAGAFYGKNGEAGNTWVDGDGNFGIGILEGTVSKTYEQRYIGSRARESYRKSKIEELRVKCEELTEVIRELEEGLSILARRLACLKEEWARFPSGQDIKLAASEYEKKNHQLTMIGIEIANIEGLLEEQHRELDAKRFQAQELCSKTYLTARYDVFCEALSCLKTYQELLTQVQIIHEAYRNGLSAVRGQEERLEEIEIELDDILYEKNRGEQKLKETELKLSGVRMQLAMTNYEEMKGRLDYCIERLGLIPGERELSVKNQTSRRDEIEKLESERLEIQENLIKLSVKCRKLEEAFAAEYRLGYVERDFVETEDMGAQAKKVCLSLKGRLGNKKQQELLGSLQEVFHQNRGYLLEYNLTMQSLFEETEEWNPYFEFSMERIDISTKYRGTTLSFKDLLSKLEADKLDLEQLLSDKDRELFEDILANTISKKIRGKIQASKRWVENMNELMQSMQTSSGLKLSLRWKSKRAETEEQLDTRSLVELLSKDVEIMREEEVEKMAKHFRSKIEEARKLTDEGEGSQSFHLIMKEVLDYRKWFEFRLECQKTGEKKKELTDRVFFTFSGGEKAMAMYVPLFSAVVAKYAGARKDAPRLISLDEAFAGVDEMNIKDMFRLMVEFKFNFMINSQILWGDYETVPALAIYLLRRPENAKYVTVIPFVWNGKIKSMVKRIGDEIEES